MTIHYILLILSNEFTCQLDVFDVRNEEFPNDCKGNDDDGDNNGNLNLAQPT